MLLHPSLVVTDPTSGLSNSCRSSLKHRLNFNLMPAALPSFLCTPPPPWLGNLSPPLSLFFGSSASRFHKFCRVLAPFPTNCTTHWPKTEELWNQHYREEKMVIHYSTYRNIIYGLEKLSLPALGALKEGTLVDK